MNTSKNIILALAIAAAGLSGAAQAHDQNGPRHLDRDRDPVRIEHRHHHDGIDGNWVDRRQHNQQQRIREGWRSGELTRKELERLREQQRRIARMERRYEADGHLTRVERNRLDRALDRASNMIYRAKHNAAERGDRYAYAEHHDGDRAYRRH